MAQFPGAPRPKSRRGRMHARQRNDVNSGYLVERFFNYPFGPIAPGASQQQNMRVMSCGSRYIVVPAMRGALGFSSRAFVSGLSGLELANLRLRIQLNALDDIASDGQGNNTVSFAALFSNPKAPWFWFVHPHRIRTGDNLLATITNTTSGETAPTLTPLLTLRFCDADIYWDLYGKLIDIAEATDEDLIYNGVG